MIRDARQASGLFLVLLAVLAQLTLATAVPVSAALSLADATVLCQHDTDPSAPSPRTPAHQSPDCLLCFSCYNAAAPAGLLAAPPLVPAPSTVLVARAAVPPPSTAPPARIVLAARPRGPPIHV